MIGLPGPTVRDEDVRLFRDTRAGGLILYRRNFESPPQLVTLLTTLETRLGRRLLVATDHEGGRVIMLGEGVTIFPDNLAVAAAGDPRLASHQGRIEAQELRRLGIDLNLDRKSIRLNSSHPSISYAVFCLKKITPTMQNVAVLGLI